MDNTIQQGSDFKRIAKIILSGTATIASFLFGAATLALIFLAILLYVDAGSVSADPLYNRQLLLLEWRGQMGMIPIVYKLIFVGLFLLAAYRIFSWVKIRKEQIKKFLIDNLKRVGNTSLVLFGTMALLFFAIAAPISLIKPVDYYLLNKYEPWALANQSEFMAIAHTVSNIFIGISFVLFAVMIYLTWRLFAKKNFIAWLGATILMAMVIVYNVYNMFFLI